MLVPDRCVTLVIRLQGALFLHHQGEESGPGIQVLHGHTVYLLVQELRMAPVLRFSSVSPTSAFLVGCTIREERLRLHSDTLSMQRRGWQKPLSNQKEGAQLACARQYVTAELYY